MDYQNEERAMLAVVKNLGTIILSKSASKESKDYAIHQLANLKCREAQRLIDELLEGKVIAIADLVK
jgi:hypothetical protein